VTHWCISVVDENVQTIISNCTPYLGLGAWGQEIVVRRDTSEIASRCLSLGLAVTDGGN